MSLKRLLYGGLPQIGGGSYQSVVLGLAPASLLAYWPLTETSGTQATDVSGNARHGTYSGVTLAQLPGPGGSMGKAGLWDGVNDFIDIFSASLAGAFNPNELTISWWSLVSGASVWTDGSSRTGVVLAVNSSNNVTGYKSSTNNTIASNWTAGGTTKTVSRASTSPLTWFHNALVVTKSGDRVEGYYQGVSMGTQNTLPIWAGTIVNGRIGGPTVGAFFYWSGYLAHVAIWSTALSAAQITTLATAR